MDNADKFRIIQQYRQIVNKIGQNAPRGAMSNKHIESAALEIQGQYGIPTEITIQFVKDNNLKSQQGREQFIEQLNNGAIELASLEND